MSKIYEMHATTILAVRRGNTVVMAGDGQVSMDKTVVKARAKKVRTLDNGRIIAGFAGSTADAFTLFEKFESKLKEHGGQMVRGAIELAKEWRTDRYLRHLEALLLVADAEKTLMLSGTGDVLEPDEGVAAIGSGGSYALAAATALLEHTKMTPREIAGEAMKIAGRICVFTNDQIHMESLGE